jgi:hypothetical protein
MVWLFAMPRVQTFRTQSTNPTFSFTETFQNSWPVPNSSRRYPWISMAYVESKAMRS